MSDDSGRDTHNTEQSVEFSDNKDNKRAQERNTAVLATKASTDSVSEENSNSLEYGSKNLPPMYIDI